MYAKSIIYYYSHLPFYEPKPILSVIENFFYIFELFCESPDMTWWWKKIWDGRANNACVFSSRGFAFPDKLRLLAKFCRPSRNVALPR